MFEYVNTSVPNGLLPGTHGFCGVAMTRGLPDPVRRRLESFSSYTHRVSANGPDYVRLNPVAWSHLVLDGGDHVLGCVRAAPFDYTGRTNRLARLWCFLSGEFPVGGNAADVLLGGDNAESLSAPWSGDPRWLDPRTTSPVASAATQRTDARPTAWMQVFGASEGSRLAAAFSILLAERIRAKGRPLVFLADPARHADGSLLLSLFADLIALLPAPLRDKATFSTYPVGLSATTLCHLRGEFDDTTRLLAGESAWIDLRTVRVHGAEAASVPPELLFLATNGYEQPPEPVIRGGSRRPEPVAQPPAPAATRVPRLARDARGPKPPVGRLISRTTAPKKRKPGFEDYLLWGLLGALVLGIILVVLAFASLSSTTPPETVPEPPTMPTPKSTTPKEVKPTPAPTPKEVVPVAAPTSPTNAPVAKTESKPEPKTEPIQPKPEELNPLLLAKEIKVVKSFDAKKVKQPDNWIWVYYGTGADKVSTSLVKVTNLGLTVPKEAKRFATLLLNKEDRTCFWQWNPPEPRQCFASENSVDLRKECFGPDERLFEAWKRCKTTWKESYRYRNLSDSVDREFSGSKLTLAFVLETSKSDLQKIETELKAAATDYESAQKVFAKAEAEYVNHTNTIAKVSSQLKAIQMDLDKLTNTPKKQRPKNYDDQREQKRQSLRECQDKLESLQGDKVKKLARDEAKSNLDKATKTRGNLETQVKKMKDESEPKVRASKFEILPPEYQK